MKKEFFLFFFLLAPFSSWSQNPIKTTTTCTDEVIFQTPGRWLTQYRGLLDYSESLGLTSTEKKAIITRLDTIHQLMLSIYPKPMAIDVVWSHGIGYETFGEQVRYELNSQKILNRIAVKEKPVTSFGYSCGFFRYYCDQYNSNEIWRGFPGETYTWLNVYANSIAQVAKEVGSEDSMTVNGYPVHLRQPVIKNPGDPDSLGLDYETADFITGSNAGYVIIHRNGMLPYIPVTRKQYLDRCIPFVKKFYDNNLKFLKESPLPYDDKDNREMRDAQIDKSIKNRDWALNRYQEELERTTQEGMLNAPAIVKFGIYNPLLYDMPIFVDEREGLMVVIENPDYMRKDLPKYVPQFFLVKWTWNEWKPQADIAKLIKERFPFEKLQAMIDK